MSRKRDAVGLSRKKVELTGTVERDSLKGVGEVHVLCGPIGDCNPGEPDAYVGLRWRHATRFPYLVDDLVRGIILFAAWRRARTLQHPKKAAPHEVAVSPSTTTIEDHCIRPDPRVADESVRTEDGPQAPS
jgi:hypothetical protein